MIVLIRKLLNSDTFYFPKIGLLKILNYSYLLAPSSSISIFLSFSFLPFSPLSLTEVHFGAKWLKMTFKNSIFTKISNKILYFIPTSFDKFFETGQFEEKTNSVQWLECRVFFVSLHSCFWEFFFWTAL